MRSNQNEFFSPTLGALCKVHLPPALLSRLYIINLIKKQKLSFHLETVRHSLAFRLEPINIDSLLPTGVSITITEVYPENPSASSLLNCTKSTYIFCKKNLAEWCLVDANGEEQRDSNLSAWVFEDNALLESETVKAVKIIAKAIDKAKPVLTVPPKKSDACECVIF